MLSDSADSAVSVSAWLDQTFNGDVLPISRLAALTKEQCRDLGNIVRRAASGQLHLGWQERWDNLDFAHIPVGC